MRDLLNDLTEGLSHPDPIRRAQIQMKKPLPKRFYTDVSVTEGEGGFVVTLDGKAVRTPARNPLAAPTRKLAELMAAEWQAQAEVIDPATMPVTKLVNTAIDGVATDTQAVFEDILRFAGTDLLCYRAESPEGWSSGRRSAGTLCSTGHRTRLARASFSPKASSISSSRRAPSRRFSALRKHDNATSLAVLHTITTLTGSALLALAFAEGELDEDEVWSLAHLDEDWTNEHWGSDEEAEERRVLRFADFNAATRAFLALKG
jgi:chaperone required for assembly of F1-ATPase